MNDKYSTDIGSLPVGSLFSFVDSPEHKYEIRLKLFRLVIYFGNDIIPTWGIAFYDDKVYVTEFSGPISFLNAILRFFGYPKKGKWKLYWKDPRGSSYWRPTYYWPVILFWRKGHRVIWEIRGDDVI